jgi:hypothetical protein
MGGPLTSQLLLLQWRGTSGGPGTSQGGDPPEFPAGDFSLVDCGGGPFQPRFLDPVGLPGYFPPVQELGHAAKVLLSENKHPSANFSMRDMIEEPRPPIEHPRAGSSLNLTVELLAEPIRHPLGGPRGQPEDQDDQREGVGRGTRGRRAGRVPVPRLRGSQVGIGPRPAGGNEGIQSFGTHPAFPPR